MAHSVWYGAIVRGDVNHITIGENSSIGDRAVVHVAKIQGDAPTHIGNNVSIGAGALVHAATLKDSCVIGDAAQILDGSIVESNTMIAPASVVTPGTTVAAGELWAGSPAKKVRALTEAEMADIVTMAKETSNLAAIHAYEHTKDFRQLAEEEEDVYVQEHYKDPAHLSPRKWRDPDDVLGQGAPGRIFRSTLSHPYEGYEGGAAVASYKPPKKD
jgi:gamma-carbonic anhydrase